MTYAILALMIALQVGQASGQMDLYKLGPAHIHARECKTCIKYPDIICADGDEYCFAEGMVRVEAWYQHRRMWNAVMPIVEPLEPSTIEFHQSNPEQFPRLRYAIPESVAPAISVLAKEDGQPLVLANPSNCVDGWIPNNLYGNHCASRWYWTCADHSRVLLQSEDGSGHWCVRF